MVLAISSMPGLRENSWELLSSVQCLAQREERSEGGMDSIILINMQKLNSLRVGSISKFYTTSLLCTNLHLTSVITLQKQLKVIFTPSF